MTTETMLSTYAYRLKLVREREVPYHTGSTNTPEIAAQIIRNHIDHADREMFTVLALDARNNVIGISTISIGNLDSAIVHPREVLKFAILANAASIILAHNHPSGEVSPSSEDYTLTSRLIQAADIIGIDVLDHLILGGEQALYSFKRSGNLRKPSAS
ncbi:MAG: JAB domain-containing protein [Candidatus Omnitrophica bacterium]|jgi:DNA repair protein RadC|nr:JAB domain-containing protein [Candidatus Omnitrophota bacterium]